MMLLRNGVTDPDSTDPAAIGAAKDAILQMINDNGARLAINGTYVKLSEGEVTISQSWSGDIVGAKYYLPKGTSEDVLGYWYPDDKKGLIGNDTITIPANAPHPRLAHEFLNFFLDEKWGYMNFADWNGYQPPFTSIDPDRLIADGVVAPALSQGGPGRGGLQAGIHPERVDPRGRPDLARRVERDPGRWLAPRRRRGARRRRDRSASDQRTGVDYPRWYWPAFTASGLIWLLVLFVLPFYVVVSVAFGTVDPFFRTPLPVYQPWWWSFTTFTATLQKFGAGGHLLRSADPHARVRRSRRARSAW